MDIIAAIRKAFEVPDERREAIHQAFGVPEERQEAIARQFLPPQDRSRAIAQEFGVPHFYQRAGRFNAACVKCGAGPNHALHQQSAAIDRDFGVPDERRAAIYRDFGPHGDE